MSYPNRNNGSGAGKLLFGLLAGVALGILYSPQDGKKTRASLKKIAEGLSDQLADILEEGFPAIKDKLKEVAYKFEDSAKEARKQVKKGKKVIEKKINEGKRLVKNAKKDFEKNTDELKEKVETITEEVKTRIARNQGADV
jgi:gas vesicle protein